MKKKIRVRNDARVRGEYPQFNCTRNTSDKSEEATPSKGEKSSSSETKENNEALMGVF